MLLLLFLHVIHLFYIHIHSIQCSTLHHCTLIVQCTNLDKVVLSLLANCCFVLDRLFWYPSLLLQLLF